MPLSLCLIKIELLKMFLIILKIFFHYFGDIFHLILLFLLFYLFHLHDMKVSGILIAKFNTIHFVPSNKGIEKK